MFLPCEPNYPYIYIYIFKYIFQTLFKWSGRECLTQNTIFQLWSFQFCKMHKSYEPNIYWYLLVHFFLLCSITMIFTYVFYYHGSEITKLKLWKDILQRRYFHYFLFLSFRIMLTRRHRICRWLPSTPVVDILCAFKQVI